MSRRPLLPSIALDTDAAVLLDKAAQTARPFWIVLRDDAAERFQPVLSAALQLVVQLGPSTAGPLTVHGGVHNGRGALRAETPALDRHPLAELLGLADPATISVSRIRSLLRRAEPDPARRPVIHVVSSPDVDERPPPRVALDVVSRSTSCSTSR